MLFFRKHCHNNQRVQVDALAEHPEVVTAQQIQVDEHEQLAAHLDGKKQHEPSGLFWKLKCQAISGQI